MNGFDTPFCGCWYVQNWQRKYLPQISLVSHTQILSTTSRTTLRQSFTCPDEYDVAELSYIFPLYDGVSVVAFGCSINNHTITGVVRERSQAEKDYQDAKHRGQTAGKLEQSLDAGDVFTTSLGNVPAGTLVRVEITYVGELKNDAETDAARFTIPQVIAPRYGTASASQQSRLGLDHRVSQGMDITIDIILEDGVVVRSIQCPGQSATVTMGRNSGTVDRDSFESNLASVELSTSRSSLDKDFVVLIQAKGQDTPRALLETHPSITNQTALRATLIPKFNLPDQDHEVVFMVDRSGSMNGKMQLVIDALQVFMRSLPVGTLFNICSFGSHHTFLFDKSRSYNDDTLSKATSQIAHLDATYRGTVMLEPIRDTLKRRDKTLPLEVMLLTDGEVQDQQSLFDAVLKASTANARFFTLGIGSGASSSLVEGIARAGRGFAQWVNDGERIEKRVIRMLKGALTPHIDYKLLVKYRIDQKEASDDEYELIETFEQSLKSVTSNDNSTAATGAACKTTSLFNPSSETDEITKTTDKYSRLPKISIPHVLQVPHDLPELYPHSRSTIYLLLAHELHERIPESITIVGVCGDMDLELTIPVQDVGRGKTIHQLAARRAMQELEEGRGWLEKALTQDGSTLKSKHPSRWDLIVEREAVRLGTTFQVAGKFCSFVAIDDQDGSVKGRAHTLEAELDNIAALNTRGISRATVSPRQAYMMAASPPPYPDFSYGSSSFDSMSPSQSGTVARIAAPAMRARQAGPTESLSSFGSRPMQPTLDIQAPPPPLPAGITVGAAAARSIASSERAYSKTAGAGASKPDPSTSSYEFHRSAVPPPAPSGTGTGISSSTPDFNTQASRHRKFPTTSLLPSTPPPKLQQMHDLLSLQTSTGSWPLSPPLTTTLFPAIHPHLTAAPHAPLRAKIATYLHPSNPITAAIDDDVLATFLAIGWLTLLAAEEEEVWILIVEKAQKWLRSRLGTADVEGAVERSRELWVDS